MRLDASRRGDAAGEFVQRMRDLVVGQDEAVDEIADVYQKVCVGLSATGRPLANFLFLGPTGCGKTRVVEATAECLVSNPKAAIRVDCGEFQHSHEIAKLIGCFVGDTQVLMADGSTKAIEDIAIGDNVITRYGRSRPVTCLHRYEHSGEMIELRMHGNNVPLVCTPGHKILAIRSNNTGRMPRSSEGIKREEIYDPARLEWVHAEYLQKNDIVAYPRYQGRSEPPTLDLLEYVKNAPRVKFDDQHIWFHEGKKVGRFVKIDANFMRLAGYYVSDGGNSKSRKSVNFTFGLPQKQAALDDLLGIFPSVFGPDYKERISIRGANNNNVRVYYSCSVAAHVFAELCGDHTNRKRVPQWLLGLPDELLWHFLDAAIMGDGCRTVLRRVDYSTVSPSLYSQIKLIIRRLGYTTQTYLNVQQREEWKPRYRIYISGDQVSRFAKSLPIGGSGIDLGNSGAEGIQRCAHVDDTFAYARIKQARPINRIETVYDITVKEDKSYVVDGIIVSNSPSGYLGHRETPAMLSQERINQYHTDDTKISFLLFDEIEKAHDALWNLILGVLDKARLTLGDAKQVDFSRAMIFMTGNIGAKDLERLINPRACYGISGSIEAPSTEKLASTGREAARRKFTPEFMNRIDKVVVFKPLGAAELQRIVDIELAAVQQRIFSMSMSSGFLIRVTDAAKEELLKQGTDVRYGARQLKRTIERLVVQPLSNLMATKQVNAGNVVGIDCEAGAKELSFSLEGSSMVGA